MTDIETLRARLAELKAEVSKTEAELKAAEEAEKPIRRWVNKYRRGLGSIMSSQKDALRESENPEYLRTIELREVVPPLVAVEGVVRLDAPDCVRVFDGNTRPIAVHRKSWSKTDAKIYAALADHVGKLVRIEFHLQEKKP